ncbi:MAG: 50S ribosomal protein L6 [Alphaproteobacteria bacterium]|nr:50S ribosomal protein L6 [Alphaproteobacteria bacterium]
MSRIGKNPVTVPQGVTVEVKGQDVIVAGKLGRRTLTLHREVTAAVKDGKVVFTPRSQSKLARSAWGTSRALVANMVKGATAGFSRDLEINGVGFRADVQGKNLLLKIGFSHEIVFPIPEGITIKVGDKNIALTVSGADRQQVGQVAAEIRQLRKPEPYKGKGIKYADETIRRKEGKKK